MSKRRVWLEIAKDGPLKRNPYGKTGEVYAVHYTLEAAVARLQARGPLAEKYLQIYEGEIDE